MVRPPEVRIAKHSTPRIELSSPSYLFSCATTGEGLFEGLQWLSQNVKKREQELSPSSCNPAHPLLILHRTLIRLRYTYHFPSALCYTLHRSADPGLFYGLCMTTQTRLSILIHTYVPMPSLQYLYWDTSFFQFSFLSRLD